MRNYVRFWFSDVSYQDQGPPVGPMERKILWGKTSDDVAAQVAGIYGIYANQSTTINQSGQIYVLLDTDQVLYFLQNMGQFGVSPAAWQVDSPRETWFPGWGTIYDHYHGPESADND